MPSTLVLTPKAQPLLDRVTHTGGLEWDLQPHPLGHHLLPTLALTCQQQAMPRGVLGQGEWTGRECGDRERPILTATWDGTRRVGGRTRRQDRNPSLGASWRGDHGPNSALERGADNSAPRGTECSCLRKLGWAAPWQHPGFLYTLPWLPHPPGTLGFPRTPKFAKEEVEFPWARFLPPSKHHSVGLKTRERQVQAPPPQPPPLRPWPRPLSSGPSTGAGRGLSGPAVACALRPPEGAGAVPRVGKWTMV